LEVDLGESIALVALKIRTLPLRALVDPELTLGLSCDLFARGVAHEVEQVLAEGFQPQSIVGGNEHRVGALGLG